MDRAGWIDLVAAYDGLGLDYCSPTHVVVPSVSWAAVLQGTAPTVFVETPFGPTIFKPGPVTVTAEGTAALGTGADAYPPA
jgi:hypothetical protein